MANNNSQSGGRSDRNEKNDQSRDSADSRSRASKNARHGTRAESSGQDDTRSVGSASADGGGHGNQG